MAAGADDDTWSVAATDGHEELPELSEKARGWGAMLGKGVTKHLDGVADVAMERVASPSGDPEWQFAFVWPRGMKIRGVRIGATYHEDARLRAAEYKRTMGQVRLLREIKTFAAAIRGAVAIVLGDGADMEACAVVGRRAAHLQATLLRDPPLRTSVAVLPYKAVRAQPEAVPAQVTVRFVDDLKNQLDALERAADPPDDGDASDRESGGEAAGDSA